MPPKGRRARYIALALVIFAGLSAAALYINFRAASLASGLIASAIGQPVSVTAVGFSPATGLTLYGLEIKNPPGYPSPYLLRINTLGIRPAYNEVMKGRLVMDSVFAGSPSLFLEKDRQGVWNFQPVIDYLKKKKPRKYTVAFFHLRGGEIALPMNKAEFLIPEASAKGLSTMNPGPVGFTLEVTDGKGVALKGGGTAAPFAKPATLKANFAFKGEKIYGYIKPPQGVDLHGASLGAALDVDFDGSILRTRLDGALSGVKSAYYKGREPLSARLVSQAEYLPDTDRLCIGNAALSVAGLLRVDLSGTVNGLTKEASLGLTAKISPVDLSKAAPYLPEGVIISGRLNPDALSLKGTLKPFKINAEGGLGMESLNISYKGTSVSGINGEGRFQYSGDTLLLKDISFKGKGLSASAEALDLKHAEGVVDAGLMGGAVSYGEISLNGISAKTAVTRGGNREFRRAYGALTATQGKVYGLSVSLSKCEWVFEDAGLDISAGGMVEGGPFSLKAGASFSGGQGLKNPYLSGTLKGVRLVSIKKFFERSRSSVSVTDGTADISVSLKGDALGSVGGSALVNVNGLGLNKNGKPLLKGLSGEFHPAYAEKAVTLPGTDVHFGESFKIHIAGRAVRQGDGWRADASFYMPETELARVQEGVLEALPSTLKWADTSGRAVLKADLDVSSGGSGKLRGEVLLKGAGVDIPDMGVSVGPADGAVPVDFSFGEAGARARLNPFRQEAFEKESYGALLGKYSAKPAGTGLAIKKVSYGLVELDDIELALKPGDGYYEISWFGLSGFGGAGYGYGLADFSGREDVYALSLVVSDFSLAELCGRVPSIKGYLSGRVDGLVRVLVTGRGYEGVAGAAMFWAKDAQGEKRKISKEFLQRLMGKTLKDYMLIGDRGFDRGELDVIFSGGDIVFDNLLISHTNILGMRDLQVSVAPVSNKISIEHLLDVIREVKERAGSVQ